MPKFEAGLQPDQLWTPKTPNTTPCLTKIAADNQVGALVLRVHLLSQRDSFVFPKTPENNVEAVTGTFPHGTQGTNY